MTDKISLRIDPDALTIGDLEDFEDGVGVPLYDALKPVVVKDDEGKVVLDEPDEKGRQRPLTEVKISSKALKHLVWIIQRNTNPDFTLTDARNVKVGNLEIVGDDDESGNVESSESQL